MSKSMYSKTEWVFGDFTSSVEQGEEGLWIYNDPSSMDSWGQCLCSGEDMTFHDVYPDLLNMWSVYKIDRGISHV